MSSTIDNPALVKTTWLDQFGLNPRQRFFVLAYLADPNATEAAREAGYKQPNKQGPRMLVIDGIAAAIAEGRAQVESKAMLDAQGVVDLWAQIATADARELTQHIHAPCRYCYGLDHQYQWKTKREFTEEKARVIFSMFSGDAEREVAMSGGIDDPRIPDDAGGFGYRVTDDPNPDCPECAGMGTEITRMADTRRLSPGAALLFDGVKESKQGVEIKMQDRAKALESIAKHFGMFAGKVDAEEVGPLDRLIQRMMNASNAVPVRADDENQAQASAHPMDASDNLPDQDGKVIEP